MQTKTAVSDFTPQRLLLHRKGTLFNYAHSLYQTRYDYFNIRISTATVDVESSTFTRLEGVTRCITPLGAGFTLTIGDGEPEFIPHGAVKRFNGAENVACAGRGRDLNLMLKGAEGELIMLKTGEAHRIERCEFVFAYSVEGGKLSFGDACIHAGAGEFFRLTSDKEETVNPSGETAIFCCKAGK